MKRYRLTHRQDATLTHEQDAPYAEPAFREAYGTLVRMYVERERTELPAFDHFAYVEIDVDEREKVDASMGARA